MPCESFLNSFEARVAGQPGATAATFERDALTYGELDALANKLARALIARGVAPNTPVALFVPRCLELTVFVLAVLKAGAGYVPLDPNYPEERLAFMLSDSRARVLLTVPGLARSFDAEGIEVIELSLADARRLPEESGPLPRRHGPDDLAYVIYTSGSTGKPKGVAMVHRALDNLIAWQLKDSAAGPGTATLQFAPLSFDVHFQELFGTWCSGGRIVLIREELRFELLNLLGLIEREKIERLFLPFIALQSLADIAVAHDKLPSTLREVITAGEQLQITRAIATLFERLPEARLFNHYGPSETHVVTSLLLAGPVKSWPALPPIGYALPDVQLYVLDEEGAETKGEGELFVGGVALARGYLDRPELTAERFVMRNGQRLYRTGDLVKELEPGLFQYLGRLDGQVKIRGHRIELGEIEVALSSSPAVREAAVTVHEPRPGDKRLVAYVVLEANEPAPDFRQYLAARLMDAMVPSQFVALPALPRTPSGKVDKRSLPAPTRARPALDVPFEAPRDEHEQRIAQIWGELLAIDELGAQDDFFALGGNSLLALRAVAALTRAFGVDFPIVQFFERRTLREQAAYVRDPAGQRDVRRKREARDPRAPIAIIGMAGRFPGADSSEALFANLLAGVDGITRFRPEQLDPSLPDRDDPAYVPARGVLADADKFDAAFFGVPNNEALVLDPQQRILLEVAQHALEHAGYAGDASALTVGVYAGTHNNSYFTQLASQRPEAIARVGAFAAMLASEKDYVATRIAHKLDLRGPALSIHTACSTSLVAIATAVEQLRAGMCELAIAGGAAVTVPQHSGHLYQEGGMLSRDGQTRSFDADATGTVFSDGAGMVVLKPLARAKEDGDTIYAVIRGVGLNNDGGHKASFSAPSVAGQAAAIAMAHEDAGIEPAQLSYVEAHGTATPVGDPIEVEALTQAFGPGEKQFCGLGSIKSNLGHLTAAAGVAGVQKVALALAREVLPKSLGYTRPNPNIAFAQSPFFVVAEQKPWPRDPNKPRLAGVSSFGVGGTNAHVILEEAPALDASGPSADTQLLVLSARTEAALARQSAELASYLEAQPSISLADAAYTLGRGRAQLPVRRAVVARSAQDAAAKLRAERGPSAKPGQLAFLFPGQGAQYPAMGENLYRKDPTFRLEFERCAELLMPTLDLRQLLYGGGDAEAARAALKQTAFTQTALFAVEYALARTLMAWGLQPSVLVGHSVGEFVAACLAGVFDLESALALVAARGKLMQELAPGAMLSVRESLRALEPLPAELDLACENTAGATVLGGPREPLLAYAAQLNERGIMAKPLETSHAFHTRSVDPAVAPFRALVEKMTLRAPKLRIVSTATGSWLRDEEATDPAYWALHMRRTVRFRGALDTLFAERELALLEVGPGKALTTFASYRAPGDDRPRGLALSTLPGQVENEAEWSALLTAVGRLWTRGEPLDFQALYAGEQRRRIPLPGTSFERTRHWFDSAPQRAPQNTAPSPVASPPFAVPGNQTPTMSQTPSSRRTRLVSELRALIEETSGIDLEPNSEQLDFVELGIDSLAVTQLATRLKKQYGLSIPMRQLIDQTSSLNALAEFLDRTLPAEAVSAPPPAASAAPTHAPALQPQLAMPQLAMPQLAMAPINGQPNLAATLVQLQITQLTLLQQLMGGAPLAQAPAPHVPPVTPHSPAEGVQPAVMTEPADAKPGQTRYDPAKAFGAIARIYKHTDEMTARQEARLKNLQDRYCAKTKRSKEHTQQNRARHADPRVVTGFKPKLKELIYPLVTSRAEGARIWDLDGNEYVDALNGFGSNFFGYSAPFIADALRKQIDTGYEIGPQTPLAGPAADLVCELTGLDRAAFCNTGSEAVMGALRIARTVTGRGLVVCFAGSYHGIFDEVIVRDTKNLRSVPAAPGILPEAVQNVLVLEYGTEQSLKIIRERKDEIAAVLVEPVQSRRPDFRPREFLHEVRKITREAGSALIFDEVITGFRVHPAGAQNYYGIEADLATYGKIVGGGMPIGVIAGRNPWMDALDGGFWQFGDDSTPTAGVTYFAGTFVRHPLAMTAALAALQHMKAEGPALQERVNEKTAAMVKQLNDFFRKVKAPLEIRTFASLWKTFYTEPQPYGELLFCYLRDLGLHIWDGFPCFLTLAHTDADIAFIVSAFTSAVREMQSGGFFPAHEEPSNDGQQPPVPGARLGRDPQGNPAWFVANPAEPGKYMRVG